MVTVVPFVPEVVQTGVVSEVKLTDKPLLEVAATVNAFVPPIVRLVICVNVIAWVERML
jgi:hypothetical protein